MPESNPLTNGVLWKFRAEFAGRIVARKSFCEIRALLYFLFKLQLIECPDARQKNETYANRIEEASLEAREESVASEAGCEAESSEECAEEKAS